MTASWRTDKLPKLVRAIATRPRHEALRGHVTELLHAGFSAPHEEIAHEVYLLDGSGRIDTMWGATIIELKSDLRKELNDVLARMPAYLGDAAARSRSPRPVTGLATDGATFIAYTLREGTLQELARYATNAERPHELIAWLELLLADRPDLLPKPEAVVQAIAVRVLGLSVDDPAALLSGCALTDEYILGAVEADFFDWPLRLPAGAELVRQVAQQTARFRLRDIEMDVLKILYESLVDTDQRHDLGEYYTPDWLAARVVAAVDALLPPLAATPAPPPPISASSRPAASSPRIVSTPSCARPPAIGPRSHPPSDAPQPLRQRRPAPSRCRPTARRPG